ncbi:DnaJ domain-containing protein [Halovenus sp. WSH3]|uniref:DnaJ domain-containing protein n=1 Tax=Halovenus carboxidivorans TaxID=2692199 RepID=A0A6B0T629_9EURY|nr:DnaJ domain-containing protein [Halovenus carboxidivorans]MXR51646.1 DnaJ domain-containing protein [Halovenus carboxidivorans]
MGESFYTVLGVERDADAAAIRRAYRSRAKECHPDVSDDPDAAERFKRLTTARDVLLDADERATYDRLGHEAYVNEHIETSVWEAGKSETGEAGRQSTGSGTRGWRPSERRQPREERDTGAGNRRSWSRAADGGYTEESWQRAPDAYMRSGGGSTTRPPSGSAAEAVREMGPWLVIHLTLVGSALATGGFMLSRPETDPALAAATGLFSLLLVGVVVLLSTIHVLTELS